MYLNIGYFHVEDGQTQPTDGLFYAQRRRMETAGICTKQRLESISPILDFSEKQL